MPAELAMLMAQSSPLRHLPEARDLLRRHGVVGLIGAREMGQETNLERRGLEIAQPLEGRRELARA